MTEEPSPIEHDDPKLEVLQSVYDRINSWEETATPDQIRTELDEAIAKAGIDVDDDVRRRMVDHIDQRGGREDVASLL